MDPYVLLDLTHDADDIQVKAHYLAALRAYPPEQNPEMFEAIRAAFEAIATQRQRLNYQLFQLVPTSPITILHTCLEGSASKTLSDPSFRQILLDSARSLIQKNMGS